MELNRFRGPSKKRIKKSEECCTASSVTDDERYAIFLDLFDDLPPEGHHGERRPVGRGGGGGSGGGVGGGSDGGLPVLPHCGSSGEARKSQRKKPASVLTLLSLSLPREFSGNSGMKLLHNWTSFVGFYV